MWSPLLALKRKRALKLGFLSLEICFLAAALLFGPQRGWAAENSRGKVQEKWLQAMDWIRDSDQPCIRIGDTGKFDDQHLFCPCVILQNGEYWLYYSGSQKDVVAKGVYKPEQPLTEEQKKRITRVVDRDRVYKVGLAKSVDGVHFTKYSPSPIYSFGDDRKGIVTPSILRDAHGSAHREEGNLVMYFTGVDMPGDYKHRIYRTTSQDGLKWMPPSTPLVENAYAPHIMKDGGIYRLWYVDVHVRPWVIRYGESRDGLRWVVNEKPALVPLEQKWEGGDHLVYPSVIKEDGIFIMLYGSLWDGPDKTALGLAISKDGQEWTKFQGNPVFKPEPSHDWESNFTTSQTFMRLSDGTYRIWYASRRKPPFDSMYYAVGTAHWAGP